MAQTLLLQIKLIKITDDRLRLLIFFKNTLAHQLINVFHDFLNQDFFPLLSSSKTYTYNSIVKQVGLK